MQAVIPAWGFLPVPLGTLLLHVLSLAVLLQQQIRSSQAHLRSTSCCEVAIIRVLEDGE